MKMCINCKGIPAVEGEDYCLDCLADVKRVMSKP